MKQCDFGNIRLAYQEQGTGTPLLLVHGFPFTSQIWNQASHLLASQDWRVIAPDLRGFGQSPLSGNNAMTTMEQFADDIHLLLCNLGITEKVYVAGLSMGGYITMQFARKYAEQLAGIVLCGTKTVADPPKIAGNRRKQAAALLDGSLTMADIASMMIPKLFSTATQKRKPELAAEMRSIIESQADIRGIAAATLGMSERQDTTEELRQLNVPVLAICGAEDQFSPPSEMQELTRIAKQGIYTEIPEAGHLPPMEQPQLFAEALAGLRR